MPPYDQLVDRWGQETVDKAFWLQRHIKIHGIDGIHYMRAGREFAEEEGSDMVSDAINRRL